MSIAVVPAGSGASSVSLSGTSLDPMVSDLGLLTGILQPGSNNTFTLNSSWFDNPITATQQGVRQHAAQLTDLLERILGSIGGNALGVPAQDPALLGTWIPIPNPADNGAPTNFYIVSYPDPANSTVTVFGFGTKVAWTKDLSGGGGGGGGTLHGPSGVLVEAWALLPLLKIDPNTGVAATVAQVGYPVSIGIAVEGQASGASAPIITAGTLPNEFAFNGVKISADIDLANGPSVDISVVVLELLLPGETTPVNRSLADLEALPASEIMQVASTLFVAALSDVSADAAAKAAYFLPLVGLSEFIPNLPDTQLPLLPWWTLAELAIQGENVTAPFIQWFTSIVSDPALSKAWLFSASGLLGVSGLTPDMVTGTGTRQDPFLSPLIAGGSLPGTLYLSVATWVDEAGLRHFYPGLSFQATPIALGTSAQLAFQTTLELAEFKLYVNQPVQFAGPSSLRLETSIALQNSTAGQPLFSGKVGPDNYVFGAFEAGLTVDAAGDVWPLCQLTGIQSPAGNFDVVDLTSPGQLASAAMDNLQALVLSGFKSMLGLDGTTVTFAANIAALIGVITPPAASTWPSTAPQPPFSSVQQLAQSISNPVAALASYYQALLTSSVQVDGQVPFYYVLTELASLFQETGAGSIAITGSGTEAAPWQAVLSVSNSPLPAALTVYSTAPATDVTRLFLGLELGPTLSVGSFQFQPLVGMHFLSLDLPAPGNSAAIVANWLPDVAFSFNLPQGFQTPTVANSYFKVTSASISARWSQHDSWGWSLVAVAPTFNIGGTNLPFSGDLNWNDQDSLQALVMQTASSFAPVLVGTIGVALTSTNTRIGTAVTGVLGLLPDPTTAPNFPAPLTAAWKAASLQSFTVTALDNPWPDFCTKFANDFATPANGSAVLGLLGWALNPGQANPPTVAGTGALGSPWRVPLAGTAFEFVSSYDTANSLLGLGLGRTDQIAAAPKLAVQLQTTLAAVQLSTATGKLSVQNGWPALQFTTTLSNPSGNLVEIGTAGSANYTVVKQAVLGFSASLVGGALNFVPVISLLQTQLPGQSSAVDYTYANLATLSSDLLQGFQGALNQAVQMAVSALLGSGVSGSVLATFNSAYELLSILGLTLPVTVGATTGYGINPGGWQGLTANPLSYISSQLLSLLTDPTNRDSLFAFIENVLGIQMPTVPEAALQTLSALGFLGDAAHGYPLLPQGLLQFAQSPFTALKTQFATLYSNGALTAQAQALVSALNESIIADTFGRFSFSAVQGTQLELAISLENAFSIGDLVSISGAFSFDLAKQTFAAEIDLYNPFIRLALQPSCAYTIGGTFAPALDIVWGDGSLPSPPALGLYPFNSNAFLNQLADLAPAYVLSTVVTQVLQSQVLKNYPVAQFIFQALGLASKDPTTGEWIMPSLLGLLDDPLGWLLSTVVLGDSSGHFSLSSLKTVLGRIPAAEITSLGLGIKPYTNNTLTGVEIYGFPFGFGSIISTDGSTISNFQVQTANVALGGGTVETLMGGISLGANFQPGILGEIRVSGTVSNFTLFADAAYNKGFSFTVGQENTSGAPLGIQLVPFEGWGTLIEQAIQVAAGTLLGTLVPQLLTGLKNQGPQALTDFITRLQTAATDLDLASLVAGITSIKISDLNATTLEQALETWIFARFQTANAPDTAAAVVALVTGILPGTIAVGTGADAGLVTYVPTTAVPLTIYLGVSGDTTPLLGLWAGLGLPASSLLIASIERTGVGFAVSSNAISSTPVFQFGVDLQMPVEKGTGATSPCFGPWLSLAFDPGSSRFVGNFDPLYNSAAQTKNSSLEIELFPTCTLSTTAALEDWLVGVMKNVLPRYVSAIVLNTDVVKAWLNTDIIPSVSGSPTVAAVLLGSQLLTDDNPGGTPLYVLTPFDVLETLTVEEVLGGLLSTLMQNEIQVLSWGTGQTAGGLWIGPEKGTTDSFGLRVAAPGLTISSIPNLVIQLGAADDAWIQKASKNPSHYEPGLSFYVPNETAGAKIYSPDFTSASINLVNVGIDFTGTNGRPLVDLTRFQLGGVSPRVLFSLAFNKGTPSVQFGGAFELDTIAISLAPNQVTDSSNPVAQNMLGSGGDSSGGDTGKNPPTNPSFSIQAAYVDQLYVGLLDDQGNPQTKVWINVQRGFGPLYVNKVGIGWESDPTPPLLDLLFDGSVTLAGFEVDLIGLCVGVPIGSEITDFSKYSLSLDGFDLSFNGGPVSLTAEFLKTPVQGGGTEYSGLAIVKLSQFSIMAVGSYAQVPVNPPPSTSPTATSMFIFGALNAPLGGVPAFFITGIAAGFSYNRGLILPPISGVQTFPLVQGVVEGTFQSNTPSDAQSALATLAEDVYPEIGEYWLAAGLKFTSFRMLNGLGLLFVQFGNSFQIALLGVASISLPTAVAPNAALAYVELAIKAVFNPTVGFVSAEAQLTPNSFVIAEACKLTGGFAFYLWFKNQTQGTDQISAGDFVITLGGYSSAFQKPAHYPDVPRLGFYWPIDIGIGSLSVAGGAYFALTPSAVMAGGYLKALFKTGPLKAWFDANADLFIAWAPFYFVVDIGVTVGVSFGTTIAGVSVTLSASLGANLHLYGPPTAGEVSVNWYVISFTIPFGEADQPSQDTLDWTQFETQFLPQPSTDTTPAPQAMARTATAMLAAATGTDQQQVLKVQASSGLVNQDATSGLWTLQSEPFVLQIDSAIPIDQPAVTNPNAPSLPSGPSVGIQPANKSTVTTPLSITINDATNKPVDLSQSALRFATLTNASPQATWGSTVFNHDQTPDGSDMLIDGTIKSVQIIADQTLSTSSVGPFEVANLAYTENPTVLLPFASQLPFNTNPAYQPSAPIAGQNQALATMMSTIMAETVVTARNAVFQTLAGFGIVVESNPSLSVMASSADLVVQAPPVLAHLGVFLATSVSQGSSVPITPPENPQSLMLAAKKPKLPVLKGVLRRTQVNGVKTARWSETAVPAVARTLTASPEDTVSMPLQPGNISHWEGELGGLTYSGEEPARFTCFDENDEMICDLYNQNGGAVDLPDDTHAVSAHGVDARDLNTSVAGWDHTDEVLRVNTRWYLGEGFTLRPQAYISVRRKRQTMERGLIDISAIQAKNLVSGGKEGGIETIFAGGMRTAAIRVPKGVPAAELSVSLAYLERASDVREYPRVTAVASVELETETVHFYSLSGVKGGQEPNVSQQLSVWVSPVAASAKVRGVWVSTKAASDWTADWKAAPPQPDDTPDKFNESLPGRITFTAAS